MKRVLVFVGTGIIAVALGITAAVLLSAQPQTEAGVESGLPPIVWTPDHVELTLGPRESKTVSVTLTANQNLPAISAQVSSSIARWVTITPTAYPSTPAGMQRSFTLSFAIGPDPDLGTMQAQLQLLRAAGADAPQEGTKSRLRLVTGEPMETDFELMDFPLPITLNIWPEAGGGPLTFNYPPEILYNGGEIGDPLVTALDLGTLLDVPVLRGGGASDYAFSILLMPNLGRLPLDDWFVDNIDPHGELLSAGTYRHDLTDDGREILISSGPLPPGFDDLVRSYAYVSLPSVDAVASITLSQDHRLDLVGFESAQARESLLRSVLESVSITH